MAAAGAFALWVLAFGGMEDFGAILGDRRGSIYRTFVSASATLLGMSIAAVSIILGWIESPRLDVLRASDRYQDLWAVLKQAVWFLSILCLVSVVCMVFDRDESPIWELTSLFALSLGLTIARLARLMWVLHNLVDILTSRQGGDQR